MNPRITTAVASENLVSPKSGKARRVDLANPLFRSHGCTRNAVGKPIDALNLVHRVWHPLLEKAGLRRVRFHDLRHTYASDLIQSGESLAYVKEQLGHSSIQITVDLYGHLVPGANRSAVDRLARRQPDATSLQPERTRRRRAAR